MEKNKKFEKKEEVAPFNSAIAVLMRIDAVLNEMRKNSLAIGREFNRAQGQRYKYRLTKDLFLVSCPLLKSEQVKSIHKRIKEIKLESRKFSTFDQHGYLPVFSQKNEEILDDLIVDIQLHLQEQGYIMPSKNDPRFNWGQN